MSQQPTNQQEQALFLWVKAIEPSVEQVEDLWDGQVILRLLQRIESFQQKDMEFSYQTEWKVVFANLQKLYKALQAHYHKHLKSRFDSSCVELLQIAKNKHKGEIMKLVLQVFGACVQASNQSIFTEVIINYMPQDAGDVMVNIVKKYKFMPQSSQSDPSPSTEAISSEAATVRQLLAKIDQLEQQNSRLENQLTEAKLQKQQLSIQLHQQSEQIVALKADLLTAAQSQQLLMPQRIEMEKAEQDIESIALIEQYKQKIFQNEQKHQAKERALKQQVEFLNEKLTKLSKQLSKQEAGEKEQIGKPISLLVDHPPCINLSRHQQLLTAKSEKIKELQSDVFKLVNQLSVIKAEKENLERDKTKLQNEAELKADLITRGDYDKLKINVLTLIRDRFRAEATKVKVASEQPL